MPTLGDVLLNTANVLYVFGYGVRDVLWLRILAVSAMLLLIPYYAIHDLAGCIVWQAIFILINTYWIIQIVRERRPPLMDEDQRTLYETVFKGSCSAQDMLRLLSRAQWKDAQVGTKLISKDTELDQLLLIHRGGATVKVDGQEIAKLGAGDLVGEMSFLTQGKTVADVVANGPIRYLSWQREALEKLFANKIELKSAVHEIIGRDLVQKITSTTEEIPELSAETLAFDIRSL